MNICLHTGLHLDLMEKDHQRPLEASAIVLPERRQEQTCTCSFLQVPSCEVL